ncbi:isochorismatase family protein [Plantibacter sp. VKM Ac-2885]|uniref:isochorismatase family protein n=1 Tax=Plantibacter TaxID=190323 RepID=UPI00188BB78D|nr:isochorismatase family protein [Plantibacter cousiniae]MBF4514198.1 isochorismatase family protein [Plantibacter sp. VKM Ac-2885]CAH0199989.1 Streptothricin hydrolase [Plantibacter cousiniae]
MTTTRRALILIDVQQEYFAGPLAIQYPPREESILRIATAIDAATTAGVPVVVVQHSSGSGAPVFDPETSAFELHPEVVRRAQPSWKGVVKQYGSVFAGTDLEAWLREQGVNTVTLVGYMTNNCVIASAAGAEELGIEVEVLSDATGAINLENAAGSVDAKTVHTTLMALLDSNFGAVATTGAWMRALADRTPLPKDDLVSSATRTAERD